MKHPTGLVRKQVIVFHKKPMTMQKIRSPLRKEGTVKSLLQAWVSFGIITFQGDGGGPL